MPIALLVAAHIIKPTSLKSLLTSDRPSPLCSALSYLSHISLLTVDQRSLMTVYFTWHKQKNLDVWPWELRLQLSEAQPIIISNTTTLPSPSELYNNTIVLLSAESSTWQYDPPYAGIAPPEQRHNAMPPQCDTAVPLLISHTTLPQRDSTTPPQCDKVTPPQRESIWPTQRDTIISLQRDTATSPHCNNTIPPQCDIITPRQCGNTIPTQSDNLHPLNVTILYPLNVT